MTADLSKTVIVSTQIPLCGSTSYTNLCLIYCWKIKEKDKTKQNCKILQNTKEVKTVYNYFKNMCNSQRIFCCICSVPYAVMLPALSSLPHELTADKF